MKLPKKAAAILLAALSVSFIISGCSSAQPAASQPAAQTSAPAESAAASSPSSAAPSAEAKKPFRIALECAYAPYNWTQTDDSNGAVPIADSNTFANGYDIQIAKKIADSLGYELQVYKTEWTAIPTAILSGKVDAGICGMTVSEERKKTLLFSDPYYLSKYVVLVKADGKYANAKSVADLKGATCTSQQSTSWYTFLPQIPDAKIQPALADVPTMLVALSSGKTEVLTCDKPTALAATRTNPDLKMIEFSDADGFKFEPGQTQVCAALAKDNTDLQQKINGVLKGISDDQREQLMNDAIKNEP